MLFGNAAAVDEAFGDHPLNFIVDGLPVGTGGVTQLVLCLGIVEFVVSCQVIYRESGHQRHLAGLLCLLFQACGDLVCQIQGQIKLDLLGVALFMEHIAHFPQSDSLVCQNVALADTALVDGGDGTGSQITNVTEVEAALHTHGHLALNDLKQGTGGLANGMIIGTQDPGRMDNTGLQTHNGNRIQNHLGCSGLGLGISTHHLPGIAGGELTDFPDLYTVRLFGDGTGGGDIDHLLTLRMVQNLGNDIAGTAYVDRHEFFRIVWIHGNHGSAVDNHRGTALRHSEEGLQRGCIGQITQNDFHLFRDVLDRFVIGQHQSPNLTACFQQLHTDIGAQKSGSTGQQIIAFVIHIETSPKSIFCYPFRYSQAPSRHSASKQAVDKTDNPIYECRLYRPLQMSFFIG